MREFKTKTTKYICRKSPSKTYDIYNININKFMFRTTYKIKSIYENFIIFSSSNNIIIFNEDSNEENKYINYLIKLKLNNYELEKINYKSTLFELQKKIKEINKRLKIKLLGNKLIINNKILYNLKEHQIENVFEYSEQFKLLNTKLLLIENKFIISETKDFNSNFNEILNIKNIEKQEFIFYSKFGKLIKKSLLEKYLNKEIDEYISKKIIKIFFKKEKYVYLLSKFLIKNKELIIKIYENTKYEKLFNNLINLINKKGMKIKKFKKQTIYDSFVNKYLKKKVIKKYKVEKKKQVFKEIFTNNLSNKFLENFLDEFKKKVRKDKIIFKKPFLLVNYLPENKQKEVLKGLLSSPLLIETIRLFKIEITKLHCYEFEDQEIFKRKTEEILQFSMAECLGRSLFYFNSGEGCFNKFYIQNIESNEKKSLNNKFFEKNKKFVFNISVCNFLIEKLHKNKLFKFSKIYYAIMQKRNMDHAGLVFAYGLKGILHEVFNQVNELIIILEEDSFFSNIFLLSISISLFNADISFNTNILIKYALKYSQNTNYERRIMGIQSLSFLQSKIKDPIRKEYIMKKILEETKRRGAFKQIVSKEENLLGNKIARKCYFTKTYNLSCIYSLVLSNMGSNNIFTYNMNSFPFLLINGINFFDSNRHDVIISLQNISKEFVFKKYEDIKTKERLCTPEFQFNYTLLINCISFNKTISECLLEIERFSKEQQTIKNINLFYYISGLSLYIGIKSLKENNSLKYFSEILNLILKIEKNIINIHGKKVLTFLLLSIILISDTNTEVLRILRRRIKLCTLEPKEQTFIISSVKQIKREVVNIFSDSSYGELYFLYSLLGLHTKNLTKTVKIKPNNLFIFSLLNSFPINWETNDFDTFYVNKYFLFLNSDLFNLFNENKLMLVDNSLRVIKSNLKDVFCTFKIGRFILTRYALSRFYASGSPMKRKVVTDVLLDYFKNKEVNIHDDDDLEDFKTGLMNNVFNGEV